MARCKNTDMLTSAIKKAGGGKVRTSADTARKLATEMGGMRAGGSCGMKPAKKALGGIAKSVPKGVVQQIADKAAAKAVAGVEAKPAGKGLLGSMVSAPRGMLARVAEKAAAQAPAQNMARPPVSVVTKVPERSLSSGVGIGTKLAAPKAMMQRVAEKAIAQAPVKRAIGGAGKVRKDQAPIKRAEGGVAKKKGGGATIRIDLDDVARRTAARDAKKEQERYRRVMGSQDDILKRAERMQKLESEEAAAMGIKPQRRAKGGAGKVRKGMMSPEGKILQAVKPKKGIGGIM